VLRQVRHWWRMRRGGYSHTVRTLANRVSPRPGETLESAVERAFLHAIADGTLEIHPDDVGQPLGPRTRVRLHEAR